MKDDYKRGLIYGLPITLGYLSVAFAFGISAVNAGLLPIQATLISLFNLTSAGQFAGINLMAAGGTLLEMALTQLTINLRYALMSLSLGQKLDDSMTTLHRLLWSFSNTDEIFAVASQQKGKVGKVYLYGLSIGPYVGWGLGTLLGSLAGSLLPIIVTKALNFAIYGMFIAIIIPPFQQKKSIRVVIILSILLCTLFTFVKFFNFLSTGFRIIACAVISSAVAAFLFPVEDEKGEDKA